jgi:hypothetical protein
VVAVQGRDGRLENRVMEAVTIVNADSHVQYAGWSTDTSHGVLCYIEVTNPAPNGVSGKP